MLLSCCMLVCRNWEGWTVYLLFKVSSMFYNLGSTHRPILMKPCWPVPEKHREEGDILVTAQMLESPLGVHTFCSYCGDHAQWQLKSVAGRICSRLAEPGVVAAASYFLSLRQTTILFCFVFPACFEFAASQLLLLEQTQLITPGTCNSQIGQSAFCFLELSSEQSESKIYSLNPIQWTVL